MLPNRMTLQKMDLIPSDMGNLPRIRRKWNNLSREKPQSLMGAELFPNLEKKLETKTNPKKRLPRPGPFPKERHKPAFVKMAHSFSESPDPGQNDPFRRKGFGRGGSQIWKMACRLQRFYNGEEISHSIINDTRFWIHARRVPFVEGTPCLRGSGVAASRRALAKDLKRASALW